MSTVELNNERIRMGYLVILHPSNVHNEMNMVKSFLELNRNAFFSEQAELIGILLIKCSYSYRKLPLDEGKELRI